MTDSTTTKTSPKISSKGLPKFTTKKWVDAPLDTLFATRLRLNDEERKVLKEAHNQLRKQQAPAPQPTVLPNSSVKVANAQATTTNVYAEAGLSDLIVSDLITSRDSIQLNILLKIEQLLGVKVIAKERMLDRFNSYLDYLGIQ